MKLEPLHIGDSKSNVDTRRRRLLVENVANTSAFGESLIAQLEPKVQIHFPYNINPLLMSTTATGSGTITQSRSMANISTGTASNSTSKIETISAIKYGPGEGVVVRFTSLFTPGVSGTEQLIGVGDDEDGFFFGFDGSTLGVMRRQDGVDNWVYRDDWNTDKFDKTGLIDDVLDVTMGNVYEIKYQWLGYGNIDFSIENPKTGMLEVVHCIQYANNATAPSVFNPTLPMMVRTSNGTTGQDIVTKTASMAGFLEGQERFLGPTRSTDNSKTITAETSIMSIRVRTTFHSKTNRARIIPELFSMASEGTKRVTIRIYKNATVTGESFNDIDTDTSVVELDTTGTTVSGGVPIFTMVLAKEDTVILPIISEDIRINPGDKLTVTAESDNSNIVGLSLVWRELF